MSKKIVIDNKCNCCGLCFTGNNFLDETPEGKAIPKGAGILTDSDIEEFRMIVNNCPINAISLVDVIKKTSDEIKDMINELRKIQAKNPEKKEIEFDFNEINVNIPYSVKEGYYEYNSESGAKSAAKDEIDRLMYSQRLSIIQNILVQYKSNKLRHYFKYEKDERNYFYENNLRIEKLLIEIIGEIKNINHNFSIPSDISKFDVRPVNNIRVEMIEKSWWEQGKANMVMNDMSGQYYTLKWYAENCDTDDMEEYAGTGVFGRDIFRRIYCFKGTNEVFKEIAKDINDSCKSIIGNEVINDAYSLILGIIDDYNKVLKIELNKKIDALLNLVSSCNIIKENNLNNVKKESDKEYYALSSREYYAKNGNSKMQFEIGNDFLEGIKVEQNYERGIYWLEKSGQNGDVKAQRKLAYMYISGADIEQNYEKGIYWLEKSGHNGNVRAQLKLAHMYIDETEIEQNY